MRLAYILGAYPQPSETFIAREIDGLRARGHSIELFSLFAPASGPAPEVTYGWRTPGEKIARLLGGRGAIRTLARTWRSEFGRRSIDAVVAHFGSRPSTVALEACGDLPFFLSVHARDIYVEAERLEEKLARATATVTCTRANLSYLRDSFPTHAARIHQVYHGLPAEWLNGTIPERIRTHGEPLRLLAVGRLVEKKGFHLLLGACVLLKRMGIPVSVRVIGAGPRRGMLDSMCANLGLRSAVTLTGWASPDDVRAAYAWADIFCCPSIIAHDGDRDGLPNVLMEAMAMGLPAVGSQISGIPEAIENNRTGLLVPPGNITALAEAIAYVAQPERRTRFGARAARLMNERFNAMQGLEALERLFREGSNSRAAGR